MPTKKKRASFSKTPHIAVAAQVSTLEDDHEEPVAAIPLAGKPVPTDVDASNAEVNISSSVSEPSLEDILVNDTPEPALTKKNLWMYRVGILATLSIAIASALIYVSFITQSKTAIVATPTPVLTPTPAEIPVQKSAITIEVLNGSGISGKAQKTADDLEAKGYTIVSTGNAKKIPVSTVQFSQQVSKRAIDLLLSELREYSISSVSSEPLASSVSARIILGLK